MVRSRYNYKTSLSFSMHSTFIAVLSLLLLVSCQSTGIGPFKPAVANQEVQESKIVAPVVRKKYTRGNKSPYEVWGKTYEVMDSNVGYREIGIASWYGKKFHGRLTSNGEVYDMYQLTAAHKALPLPTIARVTNLDNGKSVIVRVNDRGPFHADRVIDLSYQAALQLGFDQQGTAAVVVETIDEINHPEVTKKVEHKASYYLQVGAFSQELSAVSLLARVEEMLTREVTTVDARILQTEQADKVLHKVWLGPIGSLEKRETIANLVKEFELGNPINVKVE